MRDTHTDSITSEGRCTEDECRTLDSTFIYSSPLCLMVLNERQKEGQDGEWSIKSTGWRYEGRPDETQIKAERSVRLRDLASHRPGPCAPRPHLHGNMWPLPRSRGEWKWRRRSVRVPSGSLCGEWSETARGCICSAWTTPSAAKRLSIYRNERKREKAGLNKISTRAISRLTFPPLFPLLQVVKVSIFCISLRLRRVMKALPN